MCKDAEWHRSNVHENAFKKIKETASQAPILRYFDPTKETVLQCEASDTGLAAMRYKMASQWHMHPHP